MFIPTIASHNSSGFEVKIEFDNPEKMTVGG
jgi:hypothetical protein